MPRNRDAHPLSLAPAVGALGVVFGDIGTSPLYNWMEAIFSALLRNSTHLTDYLNVPRDQLIDLGRQISI